MKRPADHAIETDLWYTYRSGSSRAPGMCELAGEAVRYGSWFYSDEKLELSYQAIDAVLSYIQNVSGYIGAYPIAPANEAVESKDPGTFGTPCTLSEKAADWLLKYYLDVIERAGAASQLPTSAKVVIGIHHYYFAGRKRDSSNIIPAMVEDAKESQKSGKSPIIIGEWSIESEPKNNLNKGGQAL
ncbi:glycoside hydrolase family 5 protein [Amniculicola lignicola CBS 123094]|uniref:Glycoside hydrolase family 5 protein n=1 Tax=Amniculicola lignicola CBS 123094 TaxID=1392246 RepID=A0A6A5W1G5_9PLEO|nr:glycoside hydrolase family 5 protein [Amniculicola lignicola CBS 123094]